MISPGRIAFVLLAAIGVATFPAMTPTAEAEPNGAAASAATNAIWLDYVRTHSDERDVTSAPLADPDAPLSSKAITNVLMKGRRPSKHLHMFGDDRFNLEPRRIGPLGFGLSAGGEF